MARVQPTKNSRVLDVSKVAEALDCCGATVRREANRGRLKGVKCNSRWSFQAEDVAAYLDSETPAAAAERHDWDRDIRKLVAAAPPLRPDQIAALTALFDWTPPAGGG
jgi:hypothetical protein